MHSVTGTDGQTDRQTTVSCQYSQSYCMQHDWQHDWLKWFIVFCGKFRGNYIITYKTLLKLPTTRLRQARYITTCSRETCNVSSFDVVYVR